jgi:hypothetical protein
LRVSHRTEVHPTGTYRYLPAIPAYSAGVAAEPGYVITGLRFAAPSPVGAAFALLDRELESRGLKPSAIVGIELRSPTPVGFGSFSDFNDEYRKLLIERDLLDGDHNPVARTNVSPVHGPPTEPVILAAFVVRTAEGRRPGDFVIAGCGEVDGALAPENIVAFRDLSQSGLTQKAEFVLGEILARIEALGGTPDASNIINEYSAHAIHGLAELIESRLPAASHSGYVHWSARPPVADIEFEMDCRRVSQWEVV